MKKCEFTKEEFYSNSENKKIKLLYYFNEKGKLEIGYNYKIENTLFNYLHAILGMGDFLYISS